MIDFFDNDVYVGNYVQTWRGLGKVTEVQDTSVAVSHFKDGSYSQEPLECTSVIIRHLRDFCIFPKKGSN